MTNAGGTVDYLYNALDQRVLKNQSAGTGLVDPTDEQQEIRPYVGQVTTITEIDSHGYFWVGFGATVEDQDSAHYSGR